MNRHGAASTRKQLVRTTFPTTLTDFVSHLVVGFIMRTVVQSGTFSDSLIDAVDAKVAAWQSLLPACKKDPMLQNGNIDEIMFQAHLMAAM